MGFDVWKKVKGGKGNGLLGVSQKKSSAGNGGSSKTRRGSPTKSATGNRKGQATNARRKRKSNRNTSTEVDINERRYRAERDLHTLTEAERIKESPERVRLAKRMAVEQVEKAQEVANTVIKES